MAQSMQDRLSSFRFKTAELVLTLMECSGGLVVAFHREFSNRGCGSFECGDLSWVWKLNSFPGADYLVHALPTTSASSFRMVMKRKSP